MKKEQILWITRTAVLLAVLLVLQTVTKSLGQIVTGSCVNAVLAVAALCVGLNSGLCIALLSPFFAFLLGIGPAFFPLTPAVAVGNAVYVVLLAVLGGKKDAALVKMGIAAVIAAVCKFAALYLVVVQGVCRIFAANLKPQQIATFSTMFSVPQLVTALIGGAIACAIAPVLKKALSKM